MTEARRSPVFIFEDMTSIGMDTVVDGAIVYILDDGTGSAFKTIKVTTSANATPTMTVGDFIANHSADYQEAELKETMRTVYVSLADLKAEPTPKDWQTSLAKDVKKAYTFTIEPVNPTADIAWFRDPGDTGYWKPAAEGESAPGGLFQFDYKVDTLTAGSSPRKGHVSFDDVALLNATKMYMNKRDRLSADLSLFISSIAKKDWINLHDNNDINDFVALDLIGDPVLLGDIFEIPIKTYATGGTLNNGERVFI